METESNGTLVALAVGLRLTLARQRAVVLVTPHTGLNHHVSRNRAH